MVIPCVTIETNTHVLKQNRRWLQQEASLCLSARSELIAEEGQKIGRSHEFGSRCCESADVLDRMFWVFESGNEWQKKTTGWSFDLLWLWIGILVLFFRVEVTCVCWSIDEFVVQGQKKKHQQQQNSGRRWEEEGGGEREMKDGPERGGQNLLALVPAVVAIQRDGAARAQFTCKQRERERGANWASEWVSVARRAGRIRNRKGIGRRTLETTESRGEKREKEEKEKRERETDRYTLAHSAQQNSSPTVITHTHTA